MKLRYVLALTMVTAPACGDDDDPMTSNGGGGTESSSTTDSTDASTTDSTDDTDGQTSVATEAEGSTAMEMEGSSTVADETSTGVIELECGWREGSINVAVPNEDGTFPVAIATCSKSGAGLRVFTEGNASCEDPNSTPGCDDAYRAVRLTLAPEQLQAGTYDLADVSNTVDLQGGGGEEVECGYIGASASSGELIISAVSESGISGYVSAEVFIDVNFSEFVSGRFAAPLCPAS